MHLPERHLCRRGARPPRHPGDGRAAEGLGGDRHGGSKAPLYSGWAVGQDLLENGGLATEASVGQGKLVLIGFEATFRGTPHSTFKLLFNGLYFGSATPAAML
jgi:hypothetical protein